MDHHHDHRGRGSSRRLVEINEGNKMKHKSKSSVKSVLSVLSVLLIAGLTGCSLTAEQKQELTQQVITVLAEKGQARALAYVDQLEADGKLTPEKAEKIKAAIPEGVETVKEVLKAKMEEK